MKIKKIYLKNINSFKGEHRIDFSENPLASAGLFAIVGPTGAGKSTILDAITLALFNRIPRFDKLISKNSVASNGSILTKGERECAVELTFSCKSGDFISKWSIEMNRNGNYNDYGMEIIDQRTQTPLPIKKSEVPDKNKELIGLSYDQFIKSILLSQGEFAKFLKSGKDERGQLLEDITGTQIYRKLGKKAFEMAKEKGQILKDLRTNITTETRKLESAETEKNWQERKLEIEDFIKKSEANLGVFKTKIDLKNTISSLAKSIDLKAQSLVLEQLKFEKFTQNQAHSLENHEKAEPFQTAIVELTNQKKEIVALQNRLQQEAINLKNSQENLESFIQKIANLTVEEGEVSEENALQLLQTLRTKITELEKQKNELEGTKKANEAQIQNLLKNIQDKSLNLDVLKLSDEAILQIEALGQEQKLSIANDFLLVEMKNLEEIASQKQVFSEKYGLLNDLKQKVGQYILNSSDEKKLNEQIKTQQNSIELEKPNLEKIQLVIFELEQKIKQLEVDKERLGQSYNFEKDRQTLLKKDEACPLCGSLEHPFLSHYANNYVEIDQALNTAKNEEKLQQNTFNALNTKLISAENLLQNLKQQSQILSQNNALIKDEIETIKLSLKIEKVGNVEQISAQIKTIENQQNVLNGIEQKNEKLKQLNELNQVCKTTKGLQNQYFLLENDLKKYFDGSNFDSVYTDLQTGFLTNQNAILSTQKSIISLEDELKPKELNFETEKNSLELKVKKAGFGDLNICRSALLNSDAAKALREEKQALIIAIQTLSEQIKEQEAELKKNQKNDDISIDFETLHQQESTLKATLNETKEEALKLAISIGTQAKTIETIAQLNQELAISEKDNLKWELLDKYIGDATGKKFGTFAQGLTLARLIALANRRLIDLSDRYLLAKPSGDQDDDELMIIDQYMGNEQRSVKTLSGGETFLISLSMALALSDLASKNIRLDCLFIDEGFGTLDPETLDLALNTLEKLQQEAQKNIGIISHVESIKERIATQIRLERNSRGFSSIFIV
jgi:DNA repair protein SbcC/Rad50